MKYYIGDCHFEHRNVIGFDNRPFENVDEMDAMMIYYWNSRVQKDDEVYIAGDFHFRGEKGPYYYLRQLNGIKRLTIGNHDLRLLKDPKAVACFEEIDKMMHVNDNGRQIVLCHFPLAEWNGYYRDSYHIYAHIHNRLNETAFIMRSRKRAFNAAACINNYMPVTFDELVANNKRFEAEHPIRWSDLPPTELNHIDCARC